MQLKRRATQDEHNRPEPHWRSRIRRVAAVAIGLMLVSGVSNLAAPEHAAGQTLVNDGPVVQRMQVTVNKSRTFTLERPFARAIVGSTDFADVLPLSDRAIYIQGKKPGSTNVSLFDSEARLIGVLDLDVNLNTANLQEKIRASAGSHGIRVSSVQNQIVLSGMAGDAVAADRAVRVAKSLVGDQGVVNAMDVAPTQQVMLEVRFLEASRDASRELGVSWFGGSGNGRGFNVGARQQGPAGLFNTPAVGTGDQTANGAGGVPLISTAGALVGRSLRGPFATVLANVANNNGNTLDVLVTALEERGVVRRLAEPNLIALSGDEASFLAGGEFPVPIATATGTGFPTVTIQFKTFGVRLKFKPTVLARGVVNLKIEPEVSELDFANAVTVSGTTVPSLTKRDARTTVELRDGQTFAIAGLLSSVNANNMAQVPWLGSVPVLGALFRSTAYQQQETDLVILVTPRLVGPAVPGQRLASPLDSRLPANDVDAFLMGQQELKKEYTDYVTSGAGINGPYGHIIQPAVEQPVVVVKHKVQKISVSK